jgi:hypothetical protein
MNFVTEIEKFTAILSIGLTAVSTARIGKSTE